MLSLFVSVLKAIIVQPALSNGNELVLPVALLNDLLDLLEVLLKCLFLSCLVSIFW